MTSCVTTQYEERRNNISSFIIRNYGRGSDEWQQHRAPPLLPSSTEGLFSNGGNNNNEQSSNNMISMIMQQNYMGAMITRTSTTTTIMPRPLNMMSIEAPSDLDVLAGRSPRSSCHDNDDGAERFFTQKVPRTANLQHIHLLDIITEVLDLLTDEETG